MAGMIYLELKHLWVRKIKQDQLPPVISTLMKCWEMKIYSYLDYRKFHSAGHTFASLMPASGVPMSYVKEMMGHSSIQMTVDIYGHLLPDRDKSAVNILDQIGTPMAPAKKETPVTD